MAGASHTGSGSTKAWRKATTKRQVLPDTNRDLLTATTVAHLATARPDGQLQNNPVWFEWDGEHIKISQTRAHQKMRNVGHDPHVALSVTDPDNAYRYLEIRGVVARVEEDRDCSFIDQLSERYLKQRPYPHDQPGDEPVVVYIRPSGASAKAA